MKWNISERRVQLLCTQERIKGTVCFSRGWAIPQNADKPEDAQRIAAAHRADRI